MTLEVIIWISLAVVVGAFVQGTTGMGFALIVAPVAGLLQPTLLPVCLLILMLPLNAYIAWRERHAVDRHGCSWITLGRFGGTFLGLWLLLAISVHHLNLLIGVTTVLAMLATVIAPKFSPNRPGFIVTGIITGITETATGVGGPPLALAYQHSPVPVLRASVAVCFLVGELISLVVLAISGRVQGVQFLSALWLLPVLLIGMWLSHQIHARVNNRLLRKFVLGFALVSGVILIVKG